MFYVIKDWIITASSNEYILWDWETIEIEFNSEDLKLIDKQYDYIKWKFIKWDRAINFEKLFLEKNKAKIRQRYQDLIFSKYSLTDQLNMTNETLLITALAKYENRDFTKEEITKLLTNKDAKDWIDEQRKACQLDIENLSNNQ